MRDFPHHAALPGGLRDAHISHALSGLPRETRRLIDRQDRR